LWCGIKPRALDMLGKSSTTELDPHLPSSSWFLGFLYILWILGLCQIGVLKISSPSCVLQFYSLKETFWASSLGWLWLSLCVGLLGCFLGGTFLGPWQLHFPGLHILVTRGECPKGRQWTYLGSGYKYMDVEWMS
jgi:hypothetical protein